ncbi:MAG: Copper metallochaperone PCu(A)C, inserts Cu(I) into cytochrome oxidase subunit II [uncultured Paraburkholderia sp.]|nr:MAG: Copper metallochaperone PCu(A)C, inserts Cu(I) into cytochrome oxidase subunit II [uncultured Paraburkholderia sp.]CAH2945300.1 MAG: Copper metallochaperone PCu(A)C, inserts Cu(I) into cytochrome oxidase subunit II [uncultured Paraburkholderia sp.]
MQTNAKTLRTLTIAIAIACGFAVTAHAAGAQAISTKNAWVRWLPNNLPAAGYVTLANASDKPVDLVDISSDDYGDAMLHQTVSNGSSQEMVMVDKLTIPAHGQVAIAPGGYHVMLEDAKHKIAPGDTVHLTLKFSDGETLNTPFAVKSPAQQSK